MLGNGGISNAKTRQVIQQILQVGGVGIAVSSTIGLKIVIPSKTLSCHDISTSYVGLHVDVVPGDAVLQARGDAAAHREHQPLGPGQVDPVQCFFPLNYV